MLLEDGKGKGRREQPLASASERTGVTGRKGLQTDLKNICFASVHPDMANLSSEQQSGMC